MSTADLTELLRASRPVAPDTLRERVRTIGAATPEPRPFARLRLPRLRLAVPAIAATALAATALIAVVRPRHETPRVEATDSATTPAFKTAAPAHTADANGGQASTGQAQRLAPATIAGATAPVPTTGRAQDYQAQIGIEVKDTDALSAATRRATTIAQSLGGYVLASQYASSDTGTAAITLRIPSTKVQDAIAQLTALGKITSQQVQIQDLQEQLDQLARQVTVLHGRIAHITALLTSSTLSAERRAQLEAQRAELQTQLRRTRQQSSGISQRAALATIQLTLATKQGSATPVPASRARRTLDEAGRILAWEGVALLYALAVVAPFAVAGLLTWGAARTRRRGQERRLLARS